MNMSFFPHLISATKNVTSGLSKHKFTIVDITLIIVIALSLRIINLENWPRWYSDEGIYGLGGIEYIRGHLGLPYRYPAFNAPLFLWISGLMTSLFGKSYFILRLPGAVLGAASVVLLYLIVSRLYNRPIGIASSLMLSVATVYINRVALMDNLVEFFLVATLFCYLKARDNPGHRWNCFFGLSMGLAFLSKYSGISAVVFVFFQSFRDRKLSKIRLGLLIFSLVSLVYLILGMYIGWEHALAEVYPPSQRGAADMADLLRFLLMGNPASQLNWAETLRFNLWSTLGFISCFYLLGRKRTTNSELLSFLVSVLLTYVIIGSNYWWSFLALLYPVYCVGISIVLYDMVTAKNKNYFLAPLTFLLTLPLFSRQYFYPSFLSDLGRPLFYLFFIALLLTLLATWIQKVQPSSRLGAILKNRKAFRAVSLGLFVVMILGNSFFQLRDISLDEATDQKALVDFLNANLQNGDMVALAPTYTFLLKKGHAVSYADMAFYTTKIEFQDYTLRERFPRYTQDISLYKMKYLVLDTPFEGLGPWVEPIKSIVRSLTMPWVLVVSMGDLKVYQNPWMLYRTVPLVDRAQQIFWVSRTWGEGDWLYLSDEYERKTSKESSLKIEFYLTANNDIRHIYKNLQDWSEVRGISWQWCGDQAGVIALYILAPDWENYFYFPFTDDWIGWRQLFFPFDQAKVKGNPSWETVKALNFKFHTLPTKGTVYLDELRVYKPRTGENNE